MRVPRNLKGLPTLRVMIFAALISMMMAYSIIGFAGGYLSNNGGIKNATLSAQYNAITKGGANPKGGLFGNMGALNGQLNNQSKNFSSASLNTGLVSTITTAASFFTTLPTILGAVMTLAGSPFGLVGIPVGYFQVIGSMMFIALIAITIYTIWSAVYT